MGRKIPPTDPDNWADFGEFIFRFGEADPGYYVVRGLIDRGYKPDQIKRFVVAWCAYYNLGIAAQASELKGPMFYRYLLGVYLTAKRASERRHFRGAAGLNAINAWQAKWPKPEDLADHILQPGGDLDDVRKACGSVPQMGPYFVWKWCDLTEIVTGESLQFRGFEKHSPKVPTEGAQLIAEESGIEFDVARIYRGIAKELNKREIKSIATPWRDMDVQDAETVCCVYKQYRSGSYWPGVRTAKALARLWTHTKESKTASECVDILAELTDKTGLFRQFGSTQHAMETLLVGEYRVAPHAYLKKKPK